MERKSNVLHMFDLDGTLWNIESDVWIIDKMRPNVPLLKLNNQEFSLVYGGFYIEDDIKVQYNNNTYFLSKDIFNRIKKKKKSITPENLGISFVEFTDTKFFKKIELFMSNLRHIANYNTHVGILTARHNQDIYGDFLNDLRTEMKRFQLELDLIYFVGDKFEYGITDKISKDKMLILLQHLIGYKIKDGKFLPIKIASFDNIHFYDDEMQNIFYANNIQDYFDKILRKTDTEMHTIITQKVKTKSLKLHNHLVTGNSINKFKTTVVELKSPKLFPTALTERLITKFDKYKK